jgi:unsaturated rhamnogalacturonyl hydrolase
MACLYEIKPNPRYKAIMREWADWIMNDMKRTQERGIQHEHAELENNQELWDDTLFMTVLFLTKYGRIFNHLEYVEEAVYQFMLHAKYLLDTKTGLWYHGWSFAERGNFAKALWGRGNCWITIFIPEFLDMVELNPREEEFILNLFKNQVDTLSKYQSEEGMWHTLINDPSSYLEASATAGFCFGILKGVRKGYLNKNYLECGQKALKAVLSGINEDGELMRVSYGTNVGRTLQHYKDIPLVKMHYGQALALLALIEGLM